MPSNFWLGLTEHTNRLDIRETEAQAFQTFQLWAPSHCGCILCMLSTFAREPPDSPNSENSRAIISLAQVGQQFSVNANLWVTVLILFSVLMTSIKLSVFWSIVFCWTTRSSWENWTHIDWKEALWKLKKLGNLMAENHDLGVKESHPRLLTLAEWACDISTVLMTCSYWNLQKTASEWWHIDQLLAHNPVFRTDRPHLCRLQKQLEILTSSTVFLLESAHSPREDILLCK
jgi:hypothetical protein